MIHSHYTSFNTLKKLYFSRYNAPMGPDQWALKEHILAVLHREWGGSHTISVSGKSILITL